MSEGRKFLITEIYLKIMQKCCFLKIASKKCDNKIGDDKVDPW